MIYESDTERQKFLQVKKGLEGMRAELLELQGAHPYYTRLYQTTHRLLMRLKELRPRAMEAQHETLSRDV